LPSFQSHQKFNYFFLLFFLTAVFELTKNIELTCFYFLGYILGTEILTPDLDTDSVPYRRLGMIAWPYKRIFKHRRDSHTIIKGFIGRLGYVLLLIAFPMWMLYQGFPIWQTLILMTGIAMANMLHIIRDGI